MGILGTGAVIAGFAALSAILVLGVGPLAAFLIYSIGGAAVSLFVAWRHFICIERREQAEGECSECHKGTDLQADSGFELRPVALLDWLMTRTA